jgi:hypothetical protein
MILMLAYHAVKVCTYINKLLMCLLHIFYRTEMNWQYLSISKRQNIFGMITKNSSEAWNFQSIELLKNIWTVKVTKKILMSKEQKLNMGKISKFIITIRLQILCKIFNI